MCQPGVDHLKEESPLYQNTLDYVDKKKYDEE